MPLREQRGFAESLPQIVGLDWTVPDVSTLTTSQKALAVDIASRV